MPRFASPDEVVTDYSTPNLISDIWGYLQPHRARFIGASLLKISSDLALLYPIYAFASIITLLSNDLGRGQQEKITQLIIFLAAATAYHMVAAYFARLISFSIIERVGLDMELRATQHLFAIDIAWHEKENSGNKLKKISNGVGGVMQILRTWINAITNILVSFIGTIIILSKFNLFTAFVIIFFVITYFGIARVLTRRTAAAVHAVNIQSEQIHGLEFQAIGNIRTVKVMGMAKPMYQAIATQADELYRLIRRRIFRFQTRMSVLAIWTQIVRLSTVAYIIFGVANGKFELGFLILFNGYFQQMRELAANLSDVSQELIISRYSVSRLKEVLNEPITIDSDQGKKKFPRGWKTIRVEKLSFGYGDNQILKELSFSIQRGEKIGIIGMSGAGKSTLFKLLLKEYENFSGSINIDTTAIQQIQKSDYFKHVAVVLQETEVFNFSLKENVVIANEPQRNNAALIDRSLTIAHVQDFLHKLPQGVDTVIGEKGVKLSGGEKQRLGIARAVFKQPEILLLDEATSHLDLESEEKIRDSLHTFFEGVTAIVIAHRLTTIKEMDKILVIEDGKLIEQGDFNTLQKQKGRFYELWEKQKL